MEECRFCGTRAKLVRAHIIPHGFFRRLRSGEMPPQLLTNKAREHPRRAPRGVYDQSILCKKCESRFGDWDSHAQCVLPASPNELPTVPTDSGASVHVIHHYDYAKLKLFFISLLWRASVSELPFFSRVDLGAFEAEAKDMITKSEPGSPHDFSVILAQFQDHPLGHTIPNPDMNEIEGVACCRFYLGVYVVYVKVDREQFPPPWGDLILSKSPPLWLIPRDLRRSQELSVMNDIIRAQGGSQ